MRYTPKCRTRLVPSSRPSHPAFAPTTSSAASPLSFSQPAMPRSPAFLPLVPVRPLCASPSRARGAQRARRVRPTAVAEPARTRRPARRAAASPAAAAARAEGGGSRLYDVAVVGAGPAGLALAAALAGERMLVCVFDPALGRPWPNHYGVWRDEFESVGLEECASEVYGTTAVCVGGAEEKTVVDRPYIRVDRVLLKERLLRRCVEGGVRIEEEAVGEVEHVGGTHSVLTLGKGKGGEKVEARLVVDCTGHALRFTETVAPARYVKPMEQAAYGIEAEVVSHPYQVGQMLLMDFRDDHMQDDREAAAASAVRPTFLYVFPTSSTRAFFEETSVIAPEAVPFEELKRRLYKRLRHDGVQVKNVIEEEFSLIPMGGTVPDPSQRVVSFGGAACLVHPATGYMVALTMRLAADTAGVIAEALNEVGPEGSVDTVSARVWEHVWSLRERRQRDFLNFGAELLGGLGAEASRGFFDAFFRLPEPLWRDFLSAQMYSPAQRMYFALYFFVIANNDIRRELLTAMFTIGRWKLIRSCLPLWLAGSPED